MSITVTSVNNSLPLVAYAYKVTGLINGANTVTLPVPPLAGSFPPAGDWTPTFVFCFPYQASAVGNIVTPDLTTITNTNGAVAFTLYSGGATSCYILVA
jgi:hypothetical protein